MDFSTSHPALARALTARGYAEPTPVQAAILEAAPDKTDLLVSAQTGSGKTVAFGLAMAPTLLGDTERFEAAQLPLALIIAPTRELALQVQRELIWLYADTGARIVTNVGGMDPRAEARQLAAGAHIVVGTPGRLRDQMERKRLDLSAVRCVVLDEADEMLDLGFREDLEFLLQAAPAERQTLLFSATVPREIETLARSYQNDAKRLATTRRDEPHADIEYRALRVSTRDVENAVVNVLRYHEMRAALVFCATREAVKRMQGRLLERGFEAVALSGELTQSERTHALQAVRDGRARVLVATDVAARGLDLPDLALVIHADLPRDPDTFLHRSGRTGRAGKKGLCTLIVPYHLNRKANQLIGATRVKVTWGSAPTAEEIRARDTERFLADAIFTEPPAEEDQTLARALQAGRTADEIALALVRMHKARLPSPEDISEDAGPPRRDERTGKKQFERKTDFVRDAGSGEVRQRGPRPGRANDGREMTWFRVDIGRERNADPRWLIPLICKAGDITKAEIGSIRVQDRDTRFEIAAVHADAFAAAVERNGSNQGRITRVSVRNSADDAVVSQALSAIAGGDAAPAQNAPEAPTEARPQGTDTSAPAQRKSWQDRGPKPHDRKPYEGKPHDGKKPWVKKPWEAKNADGATSERKPWVKKSWDTKPRDTKPGDKKPWDRKPGENTSGERKPWVKKAWDRKPDDRASESRGAETRDGEKRSWDKGAADRKPWQKRSSSDSAGAADRPHDASKGAKTHRKGFGAKAARDAATRAAALDPDRRGTSFRHESRPAGHAHPSPSGGSRSPSKYQQKKKNRPPSAAE